MAPLPVFLLVLAHAEAAPTPCHLQGHRPELRGCLQHLVVQWPGPVLEGERSPVPVPVVVLAPAPVLALEVELVLPWLGFGFGWDKLALDLDWDSLALALALDLDWDSLALALALDLGWDSLALALDFGWGNFPLSPPQLEPVVEAAHTPWPEAALVAAG